MRVMIVAGYTPSLINFRGDLIREMVSRGHDVITVAPEEGYEQEIAAVGARFVQAPINRTGLSPIKDFLLIRELRRIMRTEYPEVVLNYTVKPVIYGSIAAHLEGIKKVFSMMTGLGYVFATSGLKVYLIRKIIELLYLLSLHNCNKVIFQNKDDLEKFIITGLVKRRDCVLVNGSGVNLDRFKACAMPANKVFLMICRILAYKGVIEYLEAARLVKNKYPKVKFQLVGPFDSNPNSLKYSDIKKFVEDHTVEYLGEAKDVRPFLENCSVFVLPSYHEGTPRSVLEAMAIGRPIITTDAPGCKETVQDGVNGFLVPVKNIDILAEKITWMIEHLEETEIMAVRSLEICKQKYDVVKVNEKILNIMEL